MKRLRNREGSVLEFESRAAAEEAVLDVSSGDDGQVTIQRAAPNDPASVDAYLVPAPVRRKYTPEGTLKDGWTFDTTANQYGAIGETLVTARGTPALDHFVSQDLGPFPEEIVRERLHVVVETNSDEFDWDTLCSSNDGDPVRWVPDCEVIVKYGRPPIRIHRYFCEIKTGDGSFQRGQRETMRLVSAVADVLTIRVWIDDLPDRYTVKIRRVGDTDVEIEWDSIGSAGGRRHDSQTDLSEFQ